MLKGIDMDYKRHYSILIASRKKNKTPSDYYEKHHILPKSLGGSDDKSNLVDLTAKEHFVAHLLLAKIHGGSMWAALSYMAKPNTKSAKGVRVSSRIYETIKREDAAWRRKHYKGENNPFFGRTFTPDQLKKLKGPRPSASGPNNHNYGKDRKEVGVIIRAVKSYTSLNRHDVDETLMNFINNNLDIRDYVSNGKMFRRRSKELNAMMLFYRGKRLGAIASRRDTTGSNNSNYGNGQAISGEKNPMFGKAHKASTKSKIGEKARRRIVCPHCGKDGNIANMHRWHMDNCKHKASDD